MNPGELLPIRVQLLALGVLFAFLAWVVSLVRAHRLNLRDSLLWLLSTFTAVIFTLFPQLLGSAAKLLSVQVPVNAVYGAALLYLAVNVLFNTITGSMNSGRLRRLTQECAMLRAEIDELRRKQ